VRKRAVVSLGRLGAKATGAPPALVVRLKIEEEDDVRIAIEESLESLGPMVFPMLTSMLEDDTLSLAVQSRAARVLRHMEPDPAKYPDTAQVLEQWEEEGLDRFRRHFLQNLHRIPR
jgi:hypothetical protein